MQDILKFAGDHPVLSVLFMAGIFDLLHNIVNTFRTRRITERELQRLLAKPREGDPE